MNAKIQHPEKKITKPKEKSLDDHFVEGVELLVKHEKALKKERKKFISAIVQLCKDVKKGKFRKDYGTDKEKKVKYNYSKASVAAASASLKKYKKELGKK